MVIFGGFFQASILPVISLATLYLRYRRVDPRLVQRRSSEALLWLAVISISCLAAPALWDWARLQFLPALEGLRDAGGSG